jgi:hypothetical protein
MSRQRVAWLAVLLAVTGHQLALAAGRVSVADGGLRVADHGDTWGLAVILVVTASAGAVALSAWRIAALRLRLRVAPVIRVPNGSALLRAWAAVTVLAVALFLAQENLEHIVQHGHLPLLEPLLSGQYAAVLPVFLGLGLLLAGAGLAVTTTIRELERAAQAARRPYRPPPRRLGSWRTLLHDRRQRSRMVTALSQRRGPPLPALS